MPYRTIYLQLRTALDVHLQSDNLSELDLALKPTGAFDWQPLLQEENVQQVHLAGDGADDDVFDEN